MPSITVIGAPTDVGASMLGARMGPEALRIAGLVQALQRRGLSVRDAGNLSGPPYPPAPEPPCPPAGIRHEAQVLAWNAQVFTAVTHALQAGDIPMLLGGDHSIAIGSIAAVARHCQAQGKALRVLWIDAHADANTPATSPSGNAHGMPVSCLLGDGPPHWQALLGGQALSPQHWRYIGLRSVDDCEKRYLQARQMTVFDMRRIDELGMGAVMAQALQGVDAHTHVHLSFDLDCLDPDIAPGVGTPVRGGPSYREMQLCMEMIADSAALGSVDVVELNPACDVRNQTAALAVDLIESLFGKSTLVRP